MPPQKPRPAGIGANARSSDAELRETLDLLGKVLANVSERVDAQGEMLVELAKAKPNPELMATAAEKALKTWLEPLLHQLVETLENLLGNRAKLRQRLRDMRREAWAVSRWRARLPLWLLLGGTLLVILTLAFGAPRLLANSDATCWMISGQWMESTTGRTACMFWQPPPSVPGG